MNTNILGPEAHTNWLVDVPPSNPFHISMFPGTALVQWRRKASKRWGVIMQKTGGQFGDLPKMILLFVNATMAR